MMLEKAAHDLLKLATDGAGDGLGGVDVGVESGRVVLDLLHGEASTGIHAVGHNTSLEGTLKAALAGTDGTTAGVGEGDTARLVSNALRTMVSCID